MGDHNEYKEVTGVSDGEYAGLGEVVQELERAFKSGEEFFPCQEAAQ